MPAKSEEFRIDIAGDEITARYYPVKGGERVVGDSAALPAEDSLAMRTATLLDSWLNLWDQINVRRAENRQLIVSDKALEIIGQHLWNLILANSIGEELRRMVQRRKDQIEHTPLRVVITFKDGSEGKSASYDTLKGLPWEFLWVDSPGLFLAAETTLQLVRCVESVGPGGRTAAPPSDEALRVQFVTLLPSTKGYGHIWEEVRRFQKAVGSSPGIVAADPWLGMPIDEIGQKLEKLKGSPPHVIHLVGLCKGEPGQPRVYLPDGNGSASWQDPGSLIKTLTPKGVNRPRLVILHLCEEDQGDASENFERMAPDLIDRGVPAVLALQYPMEVTPDLEIGTKFYERLAAGELIGEAVQASRAAMRDGPNRKDASRNFGTPVLYLPHDVAVFKRKEGGGGTMESPGHDANAPNPILQRLGQAVLKASPSELDAEAGRTVYQDLQKWVVEANAAPRAALVLMRTQYPDPAERRAVEFLLEHLEAPSKGGRSGRAQARTRQPVRQFVNTR